MLADIPERLDAAFICARSYIQQLIVNDLALQLDWSVEEAFVGSYEFVFFGFPADCLFLESHVLFRREDRHDVAAGLMEGVGLIGHCL